MGNNKLIPNSTQIPHIILREWLPYLSDTELRVVLIICDQTFGWHKDSDYLSYSQLTFRTGSSNGSIATALRSLREKGLIKVLDKKGKQIKTKEEARIAQELYYQINATSPKIGDHVSKNWTPKIGDTKETYTKTFSNKLENTRVLRKTTCPLLNGSSLKEKYTQGHNECIEYYLSVEERRGYKFINRPKQFGFIHKILKAGYGFDEMSRAVRSIEKKYDKGSWDFSNMANWLEKGASRNG